ncbi:MAG: single-stranded DNA-binding protein [Planctomycetota bacterium]|jgi:single-strand DNA-binding protein|nr:single-stranded DNA-binding protein [Planctomycetota bacterium]
MAANYNRVIIAGNLTRDPQVRFFSNERALADIGLAVNRRWRDRDGNQQEETTFVDVECWGRTAELVGQYLAKGRSCLVEGRLKLDQWEDKDGNRRSKLKVVADNVQFLDGRGEGGGGSGGFSGGNGGGESSPEPGPSAPSAPAGGVDDEPPF